LRRLGPRAEHEVRGPHDDLVDPTAEVAGEATEHSADRHRHRDQKKGERQGEPGTPQHAAEEIAAEFVGAEHVRRARSEKQLRALGKRVVGSDQRHEDHDQDPGAGERKACDRERLFPRRTEGAGAASQPDPKTQRQTLNAHATRIRGSTTP